MKNLKSISYNFFIKYKVLLLIKIMIVLCIGLSNCRYDPQEQKPNLEARQKENLIRINKYLVGKDDDLIKGYVKRRNWVMQTTQTGLWYMIYERGSGNPVSAGKLLTIKYKVSLLDGTLCYSSDKLGPKKFRAGKGDVETGLDEGIMMLRVGDKARFILPPHLAHGLIGDEDQIPPRAIIVYDLEITQQSN